MPTDINEVLLPAGATIAVCAGLVRASKALEDDASDEALSYGSAILRSNRLSRNIGASLALPPMLYAKMFGSNIEQKPWRFLFRSSIVVAFTWIFLIMFKNVDIVKLGENTDYEFGIVLMCFFTDSASIYKAKIVMDNFMGKSTRFMFLGFLLDLFISAMMPALSLFGLSIGPVLSGEQDALGHLWFALVAYFSFEAPRDYLFGNPNNLNFLDIGWMSIFFTSIWTLLFVFAGVVVWLLTVVECLRNFTLWWFKDVDKHPFTAVAKMTAILIVVIAASFKVARKLVF